MPNENTGIALGALADGIGRALQTKKQRKYEEEQKQHDLLMGLVSSGLKDGTVKDPQAAFQFLLNGGGGKGGKKGKELPPMLQSLIGATHKLTGGGGGSTDPNQTLGGQAKPSFAGPEQSAGTPQFMSGAERSAADTEGAVNRAKRLDTEVTAPADERRSKERIAEIEARPPKGVADKEPTQNPDGEWTTKVRNQDGLVIYEQPSNGPKQTGALGQREAELRASGKVPEDRIPAVAALQLQTERATKQQQASQRLGTYMEMSRTALLASQERLSEMQQSFPYLLQSRIANAFSADDRLAINDYKAATTGTSDPKKAQAAAAKIVAAATKQAATLAGKQNTVLTEIGYDDDEATIRKNLIQEMSGGAYPDDVERQAKASVSPSTTPAYAKGQKVRSKRDGKVHEILRIDPSGGYVLGPALP